MTYIPKNKITTNLYSNGELVYVSNNEPYVGYYYKLYNGKLFSGKNQYDKPSLELTQNIQPSEPPETKELDLDYSTLTQNNFNYTLVKKQIPTDKQKITNIPNPPTLKDYNHGVYSRYFLLKINENVYYEVNNDIYLEIKAKNNKYNWEYYIPFNILWEINNQDVLNAYETNKKIVILTEQRLKRQGFNQFLNFDYLKYFKYIPKNDLYTDGGFLRDVRGNVYVGDYHIDEQKGFISGKNKDVLNKIKLFLII